MHNQPAAVTLSFTPVVRSSRCRGRDQQSTHVCTHTRRAQRPRTVSGLRSAFCCSVSLQSKPPRASRRKGKEKNIFFAIPEVDVAGVLVDLDEGAQRVLEAMQIGYWTVSQQRRVVSQSAVSRSTFPALEVCGALTHFSIQSHLPQIAHCLYHNEEHLNGRGEIRGRCAVSQSFGWGWGMPTTPCTTDHSQP